MQLEEYLERDDRIVLPLGSTEQHAYLSLETDNILAERVSVEAARSARGSCPAGAPVRADADVRRFVSREPDADARDLCGAAPGSARFALRPGLPARPARQRARRQHAGRVAGSRVGGRASRRAGDLSL